MPPLQSTQKALSRLQALNEKSKSSPHYVSPSGLHVSQLQEILPVTSLSNVRKLSSACKSPKNQARHFPFLSMRVSVFGEESLQQKCFFLLSFPHMYPVHHHLKLKSSVSRPKMKPAALPFLYLVCVLRFPQNHSYMRDFFSAMFIAS